jgi:hypothetical protein
MELSSNDAAEIDAQIKLKSLICAQSMVQSANYAATKDAQM